MLEPGANVDRGVTVVHLAPDRFDDLAALFRTGTETRWCMYVRRTAREFSAASAAENRIAVEGLERPSPRRATSPTGRARRRDG